MLSQLKTCEGANGENAASPARHICRRRSCHIAAMRRLSWPNPLSIEAESQPEPPN
jgi:hypothetical protein